MTTFNRLVATVLEEEFLKMISREVATYLLEEKITALDDAAILA